MHKQRARQTSSSSDCPVVFFTGVDGHIVPHNDHFTGNSFRFGLFARQTKIESIPRVIFDNQQATRTTLDGNRPDCRQNRIHRRRSKYPTTHGRRQHPGTNKPSVGGFVTTATARDDRDLGGLAGEVVVAQQDVVAFHPDQRWMAGNHALNHFFHHILGSID